MCIRDRLYSYGLHKDIIEWLQAFLTDRKQRVRIHDAFSHTKYTHKDTTVTIGPPSECATSRLAKRPSQHTTSSHSIRRTRHNQAPVLIPTALLLSICTYNCQLYFGLQPISDAIKKQKINFLNKISTACNALCKLFSYGLHKDIIECLQAFLTDRKQRVRIHDPSHIGQQLLVVYHKVL